MSPRPLCLAVALALCSPLTACGSSGSSGGGSGDADGGGGSGGAAADSGGGGDSATADPCAPVSDTLEAVRLYGEAWGETDAEARACLLARALVEDAVYVDPTLDTATRAALSEGIGQFQTSTPGAAIVLASGVDARAGELRFAWDFTLNGVTAVKGIDYVEVAADGRLASVSGLWDPVPTDAPTGALAAWVAAWTATDAAARDASLAAALAPSFRYTDGDVDLGAAAALSAHIASAAASVTLVGAQAYPKRARLAFDLGGSREATDFFFLDADGRITRAARFAGPLPSP